jgi:hypothetical protein
MKVLVWHVHGSYLDALVRGSHTYFVPRLADRGPDGRGRALTWDWPEHVAEVSPERLRDLDIDVVVLQRPHELEHLCADWTGRRPGYDLPAVYLEHNAPQGRVNDLRHPAAGHPGVTVAHVSHFNALFWDTGGTPTTVIEHGIVDPGHRYTGELRRAAVVVNEPARRGRVTGTDLLSDFSRHVDLDLFGMGVQDVAACLGPAGRAYEDLPQHDMHAEIARRRLYLHPVRWTSLGLSLLEAMHLGMPVVALATTEVTEAVPRGAGVVSNRPEVLAEGIRRFVADGDAAAAAGACARRAALDRYGLDRFLDDWDRLLKEVAR